MSYDADNPNGKKPRSILLMPFLSKGLGYRNYGNTVEPLGFTVELVLPLRKPQQPYIRPVSTTAAVTLFPTSKLADLYPLSLLIGVRF